MPEQKLSPRHQRFVEEYMKDLNAAAAYRRAGYKTTEKAVTVNASRLLANASIQAAISKAREKASKRNEITLDRWLQELKAIAFSDVRRLYNADGGLKPVPELDDDVAPVVSQVEVFEEFAGKGESRQLAGYTKKLKLWDKLSALEKLGKHFNWLADRVEHGGRVVVIEDENWYRAAGNQSAETDAAPSPGVAQPGEK